MTPAEQRFWARAVPDASGCLGWPGSTRGSNGYGRTWWDGKVVYVHRLSFFLTRGRWPAGLVCHHCDNRTCINPEHLYEGTAADNARDWLARKPRKNEAHLNPRRSPAVNLTLLPDVVALLDALAAEDAAEQGRDPSRQRSATVAALVVAETKRRARRVQKKDGEGA